MGIATVYVTALPTIAQMVGTNRILRGVAITNPTGDPDAGPREGDAPARARRARARHARDRGRAADRVGDDRVTVVVRAAAMTLAHAPELVRYGSKPHRMLLDDHGGDAAARLAGARRSYEQAVAYLPSRVFIGAERPDVLWDAARPSWGVPPNGASPRGPLRRGARAGRSLRPPAARSTASRSCSSRRASPSGRAARCAATRCSRRHAERVVPAALADIEAAVAGGALPLYDGGELVGSLRGDHDLDDTLSPHVLLENLACKATADARARAAARA